MRYFFTIILAMLSSGFCFSQIHEIGVFVGGSNFIGDVGATNYISPNQPAFGLVYKWNRSPRHSFRFSAIYTDLEGIDTKSDDPRREQRGYSFNNDIVELSVGMEFTFFDFNLQIPANCVYFVTLLAILYSCAWGSPVPIYKAEKTDIEPIWHSFSRSG